MLAEHHELKREISKMAEIFEHQARVEKKIEETKQIIRDYKTEDSYRKREEEKQANKMLTTQENLILDIHNLKSQLEGQNKSIAQMVRAPLYRPRRIQKTQTCSTT